MKQDIKIFVDDVRKPLSTQQILCTTYKQFESRNCSSGSIV